MKQQFGTDFLQNSFQNCLQNSLKTADSLEFYLQNPIERFNEKPLAEDDRYLVLKRELSLSSFPAIGP